MSTLQSCLRRIGRELAKPTNKIVRRKFTNEKLAF